MGSKPDHKQVPAEVNKRQVKEKVTSDQQAVNSLMSHQQESKRIISEGLTGAVLSESDYLLTTPGAVSTVRR